MPEGAWTVLVHLDAGSRLRPYILENLKTLQAVGSTDLVRVAVQVGDGPRCTRYVCAAGGATSEVEASPRNAGTVRDFLDWGMKALPARHTMVVVGGHGEGWRGVCTDGMSVGAGLPLRELGKTLDGARAATGRPVDLLAFDACQMGQVETLAELGSPVPLVLASQELVGPAGLPYDRVLAHLQASPHVSPEQLARDIVRISAEDQAERAAAERPSGLFTLAAVDMRAFDAFVERADALAGAVIDSKASAPVLRGFVARAQEFNRGIEHPPDSDYRDVVGFARALADDTSLDDPRVRRAAVELLEAASRLVIAEQHAGEEGDAHGLSVYLPMDHPTPFEPTPDGRTPPPYGRAAFAHRTRWEEMLRRIAGRAGRSEA